MAGTSAKGRVVRKPDRKAGVSRLSPSKLALYAELAGDEASADPPESGGITAALASAGAGHLVVRVPLEKVAPHPFNYPARSQPRPGNPKWDELVAGIRVNGVKVPGLLVSHGAFVAARPTLAGEVEGAEFVVIYGHRRRAAALAAGVEVMPAVVDDAVMQDNGDLDCMTLENLGREDLSEIAEAEMFARYSDLGMQQSQIADKLGVDQATVSRRLSLLLLAPEIREAVETGELSGTEGAALAGPLPYGPRRRWQKRKDPEQESARRHAEQLAAFRLLADETMTAKRAAERVIAEREARAAAAAAGVEIVDPRKRLGNRFLEHRLADVPPGSPPESVVGAIDPLQGTLVYYSLDHPDGSGEVDPVAADAVAARERKAAMKTRRIAAGRLAATAPARDGLLDALVDQYSAGIAGAAMSAEAWLLAQRWSNGAGSAAEWRAATLGETDPKQRVATVWTLVVAGYEVTASDAKRVWGRNELRYFELLRSRVGYTATPWESARLEKAQSPEYG